MPVTSFRQPHSRFSRYLTGLLVALPIATASAQSGPSEPLTAYAISAPGSEVVPPFDYVIGADDVLAVVFWKEPDVSREVRVRPDGRISLPLLRDVEAAGLTPDQLRRHLEAVASPYFANANATVIVHEINSRKVFVTGEVAHPGAFSLNGPMTGLQALALAGGVNEFSKAAHIDVLRNERGVRTRLAFNYKDVLRGRQPDISLKPGDTIVVP
jgi:polysaccharide export outer membrane protein